MLKKYYYVPFFYSILKIYIIDEKPNIKTKNKKILLLLAINQWMVKKMVLFEFLKKLVFVKSFAKSI